MRKCLTYLPDFGGKGYHKWITVRVRNYMTHIIRSQVYTPTYYKPEEDDVVLGNHIAGFFVVQIARMLRGFPSIRDTWSTWETLRACRAGRLKTSTAAFTSPTIGTRPMVSIRRMFT